MIPAYRKTLFPNYVLTTDTSVKPFKTYYRLSGTSYAKILDPGDVNPVEQHFYEFQEVHNQEYRHIVEEYQLSNLANRCIDLVDKLVKFPKVTLERKITVTPIGGDPYTIDRSPEFNDTVWSEIVGSLFVDFSIVNFNTNLWIASNIKDIISTTASTITPYKTMWETWNSKYSDPITECRNLNELGYVLHPDTYGNVGRDSDTYTLAYKWSTIDYQQVYYILGNLIKKFKTEGSSWDVTVQHITRLQQAFENAAKVMLFISHHVIPLVIVDRTAVKA